MEGNGRTARAICYFLLCVRVGTLLPGKKLLPERIRESREGFVKALVAADREWDSGHLNSTEVESYLAGLVEAQLSEAP